MKQRPDEFEPASVEDAEFVRRLAEHYAPPPLGPQRRAALDTELRDRVAERPGFGFARPALATTAVVLALGLALAWGTYDPTAPAGEGRAARVAGTTAGDAWERDLFDPESFEAGDRMDDLDELPDDYAAIAGIFLDG